jgi:hypothetical protein
MVNSSSATTKNGRGSTTGRSCTVFLAGVASLGIGIVVPALRGLWLAADYTDWALSGSPDPAPFVVSALLETTRPFPGTELRAHVQVTTVDLEREKITSKGTAALLRDTLNAYVGPGQSSTVGRSRMHVYAVFYQVPSRSGLAAGRRRATHGENQNTIVTTEVLELFRPQSRDTAVQWIAGSTTNAEGRDAPARCRA